MNIYASMLSRLLKVITIRTVTVAILTLGLTLLVSDVWISLSEKQNATSSKPKQISISSFNPNNLHGRTGQFSTKSKPASNSLEAKFTPTPHDLIAAQKGNYSVIKVGNVSNSPKSISIDPNTFYGKYSKTEWKQALKRNGDIVLNPHNFRYIINPTEYCKGFKNLFITVIHTALNHFDRRRLIRETWGGVTNVYGIHLRRVFLLGSANDVALQQKIMEESLKFGDIVQEEFSDTYRNLTYKNIMGLKWVHTYCKEAEFALKSDDDAFVNIFRLMNHVTSLPKNTKNMFSCKYNSRNQNVARFGNWAITKKKYKDDRYPPICPGLTYVMSRDVVSQLYKQSLKTPFFPLEDVYSTGILTYMLNISLHDFSKAYVEWENELDGLGDSASTKIFGLAGTRGMALWRSVWVSICQREKTCLKN